VRRATISFPDDLSRALERYRSAHEVPPNLTAILQTALREYLARRGFLPPLRPLRITPARRGSGLKDVSTHHDRYFDE
jgi:hypothetical protein